MSSDRHLRAMLPIPDRPPHGLTTYDAKDPDTSYPPIEPLLPILEAAGLPEPTMVNGVQQSPMEGTSMLYSFDDRESPERHDLQYFERFANHGLYHRGWSAVTKHRTPWVMVGGDFRRSTTTCGSCTTATRTTASPAT